MVRKKPVRDLWKPVLLLIAGAVLIGWGLQIDPGRPTCGATPMTPDMVCSTDGRGGPLQRDHAQMVAEARAWRWGTQVAGGALAVVALARSIVLVRRRPPAPQPVSPWGVAVGPGSPVTPIRQDPQWPSSPSGSSTTR